MDDLKFLEATVRTMLYNRMRLDDRRRKLFYSDKLFAHLFCKAAKARLPDDFLSTLGDLLKTELQRQITRCKELDAQNETDAEYLRFVLDHQ